MGFIIVLILVTAAIASSAAFFSIYGLAQIFTGAFWPVVIMASSLEAGKLVTASYLYRFWKTTSRLMKTYLVVAVVILMIITSAGIFGFLSSAYQQDVLPLKEKRQQIALMQQEKSELEAMKVERLDRKKQIDADIASLPSNYVNGRKKLLEAYGSELSQLQKDISTYNQGIQEKTLKISELSNQVLQVESHVGPIVFIASAFNKDVDDATKWLILLLIAAFDPLAVALTIGVNKALLERRLERENSASVGSDAPMVTTSTKSEGLISAVRKDDESISAPPPTIAGYSAEPIFDIFESPEEEIVDGEVEHHTIGETIQEEISDVLSEPEPSIVEVEQLVEKNPTRQNVPSGFLPGHEPPQGVKSKTYSPHIFKP